MSNYFVRFIVITLMVSSVSAHDFWLEPERYTADPGKIINIDWRVGQGFLGETLVYLPIYGKRVEVWINGIKNNLSPRFASKPALKIETPEEGTAIVVTVSPEFELTYKNWEKFESFVTTEKVNYALPEPQAPPIEEKFIRYSKTLITPTGEQWQDERIGLLYEWVIERTSASEVRARLWYNGEPAAKHAAKIYRKEHLSEVQQKITGGQDAVEPLIAHTDENGYFLITDLQPGEDILINAIHMEYFSDAKSFPWLTHWASTTFTP